MPDFWDTLPDKEKKENTFWDTVPDRERRTASTSGEALGATVKLLNKMLGFDPETYKRIGEITKEEFLGGVSDIGEAIGDRKQSAPFGIPPPNDLLAAGKVALGGIRSAWSPITGVTRAKFGEPVEKIAEAMGASPTISKGAGIAAEIAPQLAIPGGFVKKMIGMGKAAPKVATVGKIATEVGEEVPGHIKRIWAAIKEAKPVRAEQERVYSEALSKRVGAIRGLQKTTGLTGREKYYAELSKLKGELPKIDKEKRIFFESVAKKIKEDDVTKLLKDIDDSKYLTVLDKISAKKGLLDEILSPEIGTVPTKSTIRLLGEVFPDGFLKELLDKRSVFQKAKDFGVELINVPRTIMASTDLSAAFRQGIFAAPRHPVLFAKSFGKQLKHAFSQKAFDETVKQIKNNKNYLLAKQNGLAFTAMGGIHGEEAYIGAQLAERIPLAGHIIKGSDRAYTGFLNKFRMDLFDSFIKRNPNIVNDAKGMKQLTAYLNAATGRGNLIKSLERAAPTLNGVMFSPRLMASRIKLLNPLYYVNPKLNSAVRKEAITSLISYVTTGMTMLGLAEAAGAEVGLDPRSANFGKIIKGNTRFDIWGGFQQYARLIGQLVTGKMVSSTTGREYNLGEGYKPTTALDIVYRFGESKENPVLSFVTGLIKNENFIGEKFNIPEEVLNRVVPIMSSMVVQDLYDIYKEGGLKDVPWAIPAIFGVGIQTYGKKIPVVDATESGKLKIRTRGVPGLSEDVINALTGRKVTTIPEELHEGILKREEKKSQRKYEKQKRSYEKGKKTRERLIKMGIITPR